MRHFVCVDLKLTSPLSVPSLPGCVPQAPAMASLIPPRSLLRPLPARLNRADTTAVAVPAVAGRADRNLTATPCTEEQPVVRMRPILPGLPKGETRRRSESRRYWRVERGGYAVFQGPRGGSTGKSLHPPWVFAALGRQWKRSCSRSRREGLHNGPHRGGEGAVGRHPAQRLSRCHSSSSCLQLPRPPSQPAAGTHPAPPPAGGMILSSHLAASSPGSMAVNCS
jgi:hypothetical protein